MSDGCVCVFQAEDGIRDLVRSRGLGDVYKRQAQARADDSARRRLEQRDAVTFGERVNGGTGAGHRRTHPGSTRGVELRRAR